MRARTYIEDIETACEGFATHPCLASPGPTSGRFRILTLEARLVAYRVLPDRIDVLHVFSGGQDYETILGTD